jgi:hypothetical protein
MNDSFDDAVQPDAIATAKKLVRGPAIGLMATGFITLVLVAVGLLSVGSIPQAFQAQREQVDKNPGLNAQQKQDMLAMYDKIEPAMVPLVIAMSGVYALGAVLVIVGGFKLKNLTSTGWPKTAAVLSMIPFCVSYSCLLGLPFGIWAFVVMGKPAVKAGFAARLRNEGSGERDFDSYPPPV